MTKKLHQNQAEKMFSSFKYPNIMFVHGEIFLSSFEYITEDYYNILGYAYIHGIL